MALATKCPHCSTIFRVAADQLKLRGGIVRCGSCHLVFDGNAALVEPAPKPTPVLPDVVAELAAPATPVPAVSDYVHGTSVDFELGLGAEPIPAAAEPPAQAPAKPAEITPQPEPATPAVWRTAAAPAPAPAPASTAPRPAAEPSPDDTAKAAVARAFAAATAHATAPAPAPQPKPAISPSLSALLSPDDAFSAAIGETPAAAPPKPVVPPPAPVAAPPVVPPVEIPSAAIDEKLLIWEDIPANESAASDAAAMAAVARAFSSASAPASEAKTPLPEAAPVIDVAAPIAPEPAPEPAAPLHAEEAAPAELRSLVEELPAPADQAPDDEMTASAAPEAVPAVLAPAPADELPMPVEEAPLADELPLPVEEAPPADELPLPVEEAPLADALPLVEELPAAADEAPVDEVTATAAPEPEEDASAPPGAALVEAVEQWSDDNVLPDGRIEPMLDTPQEHLVLAALDDAHHFEDLPPVDLPVEEPVAAEAGAEAGDEQSLADEPLSADNAAHDLAPAGEPWSLSEPDTDQTALHAVAAVNTDAPDDGESLLDDEQAAFAARMRAIAGVDEAEDLDHSDLSFVKRVERSQKYGKAMTISMTLGVPLLLAGLALQAGTTFRDTLAANYPQLKPALVAMCKPLGCKVSLPAQLDALSVEQGELATMAENTFSFSTVLRNQSKTAQAWPHVELTLNDNADKPVLRRVFAPREYLPSPAEADKGFGPHSEQSIKLYFELKELKASGYHIAIFYP